ncbi:MAG: hypothetical protein O6761_06945 [Thaumarchaeota archaeon]|nr:hypothetical protein [Nitrososphaerota archaeon]
MNCPDCSSSDIRTYSFFNKETDGWEWRNGCNECDWEKRNEEEEKLHPHYYTRMIDSPAMISSKDIAI